MTDKRDNKKKKNLNQNRGKQNKARVERKNETLAFGRAQKKQNQHIRIKQDSNSRNEEKYYLQSKKQMQRNNNSRSKSSGFLRLNQNIHNDVKTTYNKSEETVVKKKKSISNVNFNRKGVIAICGLITILFFYFTYVLFQQQIVQHDEMSKMANNQYYRKIVSPPKRGDILDRNGKVLATTTNTYRVGITPKHVYSLSGAQSAEQIVSKFVEILSVDKAELEENLSKTDETYIQIAKDVTQEKADLLDQYLFINQIGGVRLDAVPKRVYMNEDVASQVIGFASMGDSLLEGRLGVEYQLNDVLSGQEGYSFGARDNYLNSGLIPFSQSTELNTKDGSNVYLTIDYDINKELQKHVQDAVESLQGADGGLGLVMNVRSGEVMGMASYPYFSSADPTAEPTGIEYEGVWNPENQKSIDFLMENVWRNKVVSDVFEVGSTFKILTLAMGLEENITDEEKVYNDAPIDVLDYTIKCWSEEGHGHETIADAFTLSCNPPFVQIGLSLGVEKFYDYIKAFGFKNTSGVELPGEAVNIFHENPSVIDLATLTFGEQSGFNLMSYSKGLSSVVNGGNLMKPTIVKQITNQQGNIIKVMEPEIERRVISEKTSDRVNQLLSRNDVMQGINTVSSGYQLGGKTSTSVNEFTDELTMSYVSFAPIENPEYMVIIVVKKVVDHKIGSDALINNVSGLMDFTLDHMNIQRNYENSDLKDMEQTIEIPDLRGLELEDAKYSLGYKSIDVVPGVDMDVKDTIGAVVPAPGTLVHNGSRIYVYPDADIEEDLVAVPDFRGKNYRECILAANAAGFVLEFSGDFQGLALEQEVISATVEKDVIEEITETTVGNENVFEENEENTSAQSSGQNAIQYAQRGAIIHIVLGSNEIDQ